MRLDVLHERGGTPTASPASSSSLGSTPGVVVMTKVDGVSKL